MQADCGDQPFRFSLRFCSHSFAGQHHIFEHKYEYEKQTFSPIGYLLLVIKSCG
jgi:hypothetical protein